MDSGRDHRSEKSAYCASSEIAANLNGIFFPDKNLSRAVNQQSCLRALGRAVRIGASLLIKCLGYPLRRGNPADRSGEKDASNTKSRTGSYAFDPL
jgi:hypothetical protein